VRLSVIGIGDSGEARLLRDLLEAQGHELRLVLAGKPSDVLAGFGFYDEAADAAVISAHGDGKGIIFPELAPGVDVYDLPGDRLTPHLFRHYLDMAPPLVVSTACDSGTPGFADAFRKAGARAYLAPEGDPEGADIAIWIAVFFRQLTCGSAADALRRANGAVGPESGFSVFS
jgi:hypothetical protein